LAGAQSDDGKAVLLDVDIGRYIDVSLVDVDVQPKLVRMLCKGRLLQLELFEEVNPDKSNAQRSKTTGHLVITMPKVRPHASAGRSVACCHICMNVVRQGERVCGSY